MEVEDHYRVSGDSLGFAQVLNPFCAAEVVSYLGSEHQLKASIFKRKVECRSDDQSTGAFGAQTDEVVVQIGKARVPTRF